jgi:hypothetical protein
MGLEEVLIDGRVKETCSDFGAMGRWVICKPVEGFPYHESRKPLIEAGLMGRWVI